MISRDQRADSNGRDAHRPRRPRPRPVKPKRIPAELRKHAQWVVWKYVWNPKKKCKDGSGRRGDWDKPPFSVQSERLARIIHLH